MNSKFRSLIDEAKHTQELLKLDHFILPEFSSIGGYNIIYRDKEDNVLCWRCATKDLLEWMESEEEKVTVKKTITAITFMSNNTEEMLELVNRLWMNNIAFVCSFIQNPHPNALIAVPLDQGTDQDKSFILSLQYDYPGDPFPLADYGILEEGEYYCEECSIQIGGEE